MRLIVLVGWAIYPLGYIFGLMMGSVDADTKLDLQSCGFCKQNFIRFTYLDSAAKDQHCIIKTYKILKNPLFRGFFLLND